MITLIIALVSVTTQVLSLLLLVYVILSFFMSPFHPIREAIGRILNPLLVPIRNLLPQTGMIDFSPLVLWILLDLLRRVVVSTLLPFA